MKPKPNEGISLFMNESWNSTTIGKGYNKETIDTVDTGGVFITIVQ